MDKKFMKIKRYIIPVMTIIVMTSQLMGCASVSSNEMLELLQAGESIEIEVALPAYYEAEQGENILSEWTELGSQSNYKEYRLAFDDIFHNYSFETGKKNGPAYIDLEGNWTNNSTLYYAMLNKVFAEKLASTDGFDSLVEAIQENYVDIEEPSTTEARAVAINAYFNLFSDNAEAYANPNSTLTRGEFLAGLAKADTPVDKSLTASPEMLACIGEDSETVILAELTEADSYLNITDKSLDAVTFNGTISKAEAVYTIVQRYFSEEFKSVTGKEEAYADTKNAGNIALRAKFINEKEGTYPDKWKAYTLSSMLQNPEKGMDEVFYKSYVVAKQVGLLPKGTTDSNWDEAITKAESIDLILRAYEAIVERDGYKTTSELGLNEGSVVGRGDQSEVNSGNGSDVEVDGELVEGTTLTQEEIDAYNANSDFKYNAEDNTVTCPDGDVLEVVGQPGDSWKRMDESTAKGILAKGDPTGKLEDYTSMEEYYKARDEYMAAEYETGVKEWRGSMIQGKWYYDYYQWKAKSDELDGKVIDFERSQLENYDEEFWCD